MRSDEAGSSATVALTVCLVLQVTLLLSVLFWGPTRAGSQEQAPQSPAASSK